MSSPSHVVSTLNRYVFLDSPNVAFLHRIALQQEQADNLSDDVPSFSIKLTFTFQYGKHSVYLRLRHTPSSAVPTSSSLPSSVATAEEWIIESIAATHQDLVTRSSGCTHTHVHRNHQCH